MIGFNKDTEKDLLAATSPFVFSVVNERTVMRFLKLIQCDNGKIGTYAKLIDDRNDTAHSNGNIYFSSEEDLGLKIHEIIRVVNEIQGHSKAIIVEGYRRFLTDSADPEEREHIEIYDQVREVLIHESYMSYADLKFCAEFDIAEFAEHPHLAEIEALHAEVVGWIESEEALAA